VVVRPFSVYGPGEPRGRLIPELLACLAAGRPFRTTAETYRRDLIHIDDVVEGCLRAATHAAAPGETLNLGTGREWSTEEVVAVAEAVTGRTVALAKGAFPARPPDTAHWVADTSRARAVLGWHASTPLPDGLARTIAGRQTVAS
jgi:nucleoside-diphosphate-sugar epimerase